MGVCDKPCLVIEGLIQRGGEPEIPTGAAGTDGRHAVLYSGTLEPELGVAELLEAFAAMPDYDLWICGQGSMDAGGSTRRGKPCQHPLFRFCLP